MKESSSPLLDCAKMASVLFFPKLSRSQRAENQLSLCGKRKETLVMQATVTHTFAFNVYMYVVTGSNFLWFENF